MCSRKTGRRSITRASAHFGLLSVQIVWPTQLGLHGRAKHSLLCLLLDFPLRLCRFRAWTSRQVTETMSKRVTENISKRVPEHVSKTSAEDTVKKRGAAATSSIPNPARQEIHNGRDLDPRTPLFVRVSVVCFTKFSNVLQHDQGQDPVANRRRK